MKIEIGHALRSEKFLSGETACPLKNTKKNACISSSTGLIISTETICRYGNNRNIALSKPPGTRSAVFSCPGIKAQFRLCLLHTQNLSGTTINYQGQRKGPRKKTDSRERRTHETRGRIPNL